jgi:hypothetical protein
LAWQQQKLMCWYVCCWMNEPLNMWAAVSGREWWRWVVAV